MIGAGLDVLSRLTLEMYSRGGSWARYIQDEGELDALRLTALDGDEVRPFLANHLPSQNHLPAKTAESIVQFHRRV